MTPTLYWIAVLFCIPIAAGVLMVLDRRARRPKDRPDPGRFAEREAWQRIMNKPPERFGGIDPTLRLTEEDRRIIREHAAKSSVAPRDRGGFSDEPIVFKRHNPDHNPPLEQMARPHPITQAGLLGAPRAPRMVIGDAHASTKGIRATPELFGGPSGAGIDPVGIGLGYMAGQLIHSTPEPAQAAEPTPDTGGSCPDTGFAGSYDGGGFDGGSSGGGE